MAQTHRPTFELAGSNCFYAVNIDGEITFDGEISSAPQRIMDAIEAHARNGYHADCAICQAQDPRTPEQRDLDERDDDEWQTRQSARP
jgi:hypothetical protein